MEYFEVVSSTPGFPVPVRGVLVLSCLRIFEGLGGFAKPALVPAPPMQPPGQAIPSIMQFLSFPAFARVRTFLTFGKAFCVFDVDWYIGIVFLQTVFDGSGYAPAMA